MNAVSGGTVPARLRPNKLLLCAKSWPIIQIHSLSLICSEFRRTPSFPAVHPRALRHQNRAKPPSQASRPNRKGSARVSRVGFGVSPNDLSVTQLRPPISSAAHWPGDQGAPYLL